MTQLWLLVRRDVMMLSFKDHFIIFAVLLSSMLITTFMLWIGGNILEMDAFSFLAILTILTIIYPVYLASNSPDFLHIQGFQIPHPPFLKDILPLRITEKLVAEFIYLAVLFPLIQAVILLLPFIIFRADFFIWISTVETVVILCFPLSAYLSFTNTAIKNIPIFRYKSIQFLAMIIGGGWIGGWLFLFKEKHISLPLHYLALVTVVTTLILLWATYRVQSKNEKR